MLRAVYGDTIPLETITEQFACVCPCVHVSTMFVCCCCFFLDMQGRDMYHPIRIISVTANIFNSKDAVGVGEGYRRGCKSLLELPVFQVCLSARCLTLTGAGDECNLRQPMELTDSWESKLPAVKVSIFKAHQLQWEGSRKAHMPALTVMQESVLLFVYCYTTHTNKYTQWSTPLQRDIYQTRKCNCECCASLDCRLHLNPTIICMNLINFSPILSCLFWI